jgi:hypothetical protein
MRWLVSAMLIIVGVIHLLPLSGVLGRARLVSLYGVPIEDPNLEILMRHRAVLFGLLGVFLIYAALKPPFQLIGLLAGLISVVSFMVLAWSVQGRCHRARMPRDWNLGMVARCRIDLVLMISGA